MNSAMTDHRLQIEKATWSPATVQSRLRRAMALLPPSQAAVSSGFQSTVRWLRPIGEIAWAMLKVTTVAVHNDPPRETVNLVAQIARRCPCGRPP